MVVFAVAGSNISSPKKSSGPDPWWTAIIIL